MIQFFRRLRRGPDIKRELVELLRGDRLVIAAGVGQPRRDRRAEFEAEAAAEVRNHPLGVLPFRQICGIGSGQGRRLGELEQSRSLLELAGDRHHRAFQGGSTKQSLDSVGDVFAGGLDPDHALAAKQGQRPGLVRQRAGIGLDRVRNDDESVGTQRLDQPGPERARLRLIGAVEQIKADLAGGLVDRPANRALGDLHGRGGCAVREA